MNAPERLRRQFVRSIVNEDKVHVDYCILGTEGKVGGNGSGRRIVIGGELHRFMRFSLIARYMDLVDGPESLQSLDEPFSPDHSDSFRGYRSVFNPYKYQAVGKRYVTSTIPGEWRQRRMSPTIAVRDRYVQR